MGRSSSDFFGAPAPTAHDAVRDCSALSYEGRTRATNHHPLVFRQKLRQKQSYEATNTGPTLVVSVGPAPRKTEEVYELRRPPQFFIDLYRHQRPNLNADNFCSQAIHHLRNYKQIA